MLRVWLGAFVLCMPWVASAEDVGEPVTDQPVAAPPVTDQPVTTEPTAMTAEPVNKYPNGLRLMVSDLTIMRLNPTGLETRARIGVQKKLYPSDKKITENNFFFAGV